MDDDSARSENEPSLQVVLDALDDPDCRAILIEATEPMTATELMNSCDIPESTMYRKLELLRNASLVHEMYSIHPKRGRITRFERDFDDLEISADKNDGFTFTIRRPARSTQDRLADMWSKMGEEL